MREMGRVILGSKNRRINFLISKSESFMGEHRLWTPLYQVSVEIRNHASFPFILTQFYIMSDAAATHSVTVTNLSSGTTQETLEHFFRQVIAYRKRATLGESPPPSCQFPLLHTLALTAFSCMKY